MTKGLVTQIGEWLDRKFSKSAKEVDLDRVERVLNERLVKLEGHFTASDLSDLRTRLEKLELYTGMSRKVDVAKPVVAKSAFAM